MTRNLTIIDGHNYLFRSFYGVPETATTKSGIKVNAVYGFFAELRKLFDAFPDNHLFVVFDSETGIGDKLDVRPDYKDNRIVNTDMFKQLPIIKQLLEIMNVPFIEHPKYEADDVIASLASQTEGKVIISSNDFDFIQLVSNKIILLRNAQGKLIDCNIEYINQRFGIEPSQYVDYLSLIGDKTDKIKGVPKVGPKTAVKLLSNADGISTLSLEHQEIFNQNRKFITMLKDIPFKELWSEPFQEINKEVIKRKTNDNLKYIGIVWRGKKNATR